MDITAKTGLLAVLGSPIRHSLSPAMHNCALRTLGLDYVYLAFDMGIDELEQGIRGLQQLGFRGCNLTMPLKRKIIEFCDELSMAARISGSVNTVVHENGRLIGHTTDGSGFFLGMKEKGHTFIGKKLVVLGAGGAAVSIVTQGAIDGIKEITVLNRKGKSYDDMKRIGKRLQEETGCMIHVLEPEEEKVRKSLKESDGVVQCTSLGMSPNEHLCIVPDSSYFHKDLVVADVIYNPRETLFMKYAKEAGAVAYNGLDMLLYQGAIAFELWTSQKMPVNIVKREVFSK